MAKLDLKQVLQKADCNDYGFYSKLEADEKKEISPWVLMRFMSSCSGVYPEHYLLCVNDIVNCDFNTLSKHKELQWKLLSVCGVGNKQYHPWIAPGKGQKKNKIELFVLELYPHFKNDDIELFLLKHTVDDLILLAKQHGYSDDEIENFTK